MFLTEFTSQRGRYTSELYLYYTTTDSFDTLSSSLFSAIAVCDATRSPPLDSVAQPDTMEGLATPTFTIFSHFCFEREETTL